MDEVLDGLGEWIEGTEARINGLAERLTKLEMIPAGTGEAFCSDSIGPGAEIWWRGLLIRNVSHRPMRIEFRVTEE
jgi:hypothetical protein